MIRLVHLAEGVPLKAGWEGVVGQFRGHGVSVTEVTGGGAVPLPGLTRTLEQAFASGGDLPLRVDVPSRSEDIRKYAWEGAQAAAALSAHGIICHGWALARSLAGNERFRKRLILWIEEDDLDQFTDPARQAASEIVFRNACLVFAPRSVGEELIRSGHVLAGRLVVVGGTGFEIEGEPTRPWRTLMGRSSKVPIGMFMGCALAETRSLEVASERPREVPASDRWDLAPEGAEDVHFLHSGRVILQAREGGCLHVHIVCDAPDADEKPSRAWWRILQFHNTWSLGTAITSDQNLAYYAAKHPTASRLLQLRVPEDGLDSWGGRGHEVETVLGRVRYVAVTSELGREDVELIYPDLSGRVLVLQGGIAQSAGNSETRHESALTIAEMTKRCGLSRFGVSPRGVVSKRIVLSSHDFKFCRHLIEELARREDVELRLDKWATQHCGDWRRSDEHVSWADTIWTDFASGSAEWYTRNARPGQLVIVRVHGYEVTGGWADGVDFRRADRVVFVSEHLRDLGVARWHLDPARTVVIPNAVDTISLARQKTVEAPYTLGLLGWTPSLKRLDRAVALVERLARHDGRYRLLVRGAPPTRSGWVLREPKERVRYQAIFERLRSDPDLSARVQFEEPGPDVARWFQEIGWILSPSDRESFHLAAVEGMAAGSIPIVWDRDGARTVFPSEFLVTNTEDAVARIVRHPSEWEDLRLLARRSAVPYDTESVAPRWLEVLGLE